MKRSSFLPGTFLLLSAAVPLAAQQSATQLVRFQVLVQQQVAVQKMPAPLAPRGSTAAVASGSYRFAANEANRKISASLDQAMPAGSSLAVTMGAPTGARSSGEITLGTDATDVVTSIPASNASELPMRYAVRAPDGIRGSEQRVVTYTVTAAP